MHTITEITNEQGRRRLIVTCACGKTQVLKANPKNKKRLARYDVIYCGQEACEDRPETMPAGWVRQYDFYAAAGFRGWFLARATPEDAARINRAKTILARALAVSDQQ